MSNPREIAKKLIPVKVGVYSIFGYTFEMHTEISRPEHFDYVPATFEPLLTRQLIHSKRLNPNARSRDRPKRRGCIVHGSVKKL